MNAIFKTYNRGHSILELMDILTNDSLTKSETELDFTNKMVNTR